MSNVFKKFIDFYFFFVTYTILQSITSSEMCSLYLTHPSAHTFGAVGTVHSVVDAQEMLQHGHRMQLYTRFTCLKHAKLY